MQEQREMIAEQFMRGVYSGDTSVVDELATEDIVISYPVFEKLFRSPTIKGRSAVMDFSVGFSSRWIDAELIIHERITEGNRVVLIWSFEARNVGSATSNEASTNEIHKWGGITLFRFDSSGRIEAEIGEESTPGPIERIKSVEGT